MLMEALIKLINARIERQTNHDLSCDENFTSFNTRSLFFINHVITRFLIISWREKNKTWNLWNILNIIYMYNKNMEK